MPVDPTLPRTKPCEWCGRIFSRDERKDAYTNARWKAKRFCGRDCANEAKRHFLLNVSREDHPGWKGDAAAVETGRCRARRMYPETIACERCGHAPDEGDWPIERHHKDENTRNNSPENIEMLCRRCHKRHHVAGRAAA